MKGKSEFDIWESGSNKPDFDWVRDLITTPGSPEEWKRLYEGTWEANCPENSDNEL